MVRQKVLCELIYHTLLSHYLCLLSSLFFIGRAQNKYQYMEQFDSHLNIQLGFLYYVAQSIPYNREKRTPSKLYLGTYSSRFI